MGVDMPWVRVGVALSKLKTAVMGGGGVGDAVGVGVGEGVGEAVGCGVGDDVGVLLELEWELVLRSKKMK